MQDLILDAEMYHYGATFSVTTLKGIAGDCDLRTRTIRLAADLSPVERRSTAMHELGHIVLGHVPSWDEAENEAHEDAADRWAAERLISAVCLKYARSIARDLREIAEILWVDRRILDARIAILRETEMAVLHSMTRTILVD